MATLINNNKWDVENYYKLLYLVIYRYTKLVNVEDGPEWGPGSNSAKMNV